MSYKKTDIRDKHNDLTPAQVRAARALLAWSQQDLAKHAQVATSTIADFERGQRTPVANNADAIRSALEGAGVHFLDGGAVTGMASPPVPQFAAGQPLRWIDATDLAHWADRRDGQAMLPELIARLILAQYGTRAALRIPWGDSVHFSGWDGATFVEQETTYVPAGAARWEFGAQKNRISEKASSDYLHRKQDPIDVDPSATTYVHVTPRRWTQKAKWSAQHDAERHWREVRTIDGDDLIHWIERHPSVGHWLAVEIGKRPASLRQLREVWDEWALATAPALPAPLMLANRDEEATRVLRWLMQPASVLTVQAETAEEAMAFLHAAIGQLPPHYREAYLSRCLVSMTGDAMRALKTSLTPLTIVTPDNEPGLCQDLARRGHHVFVALGAEAGTSIGDIVLPRPHREDVRQALSDMGLRDVDQLSSDAGRSLTILRRLIPAARGRLPTWASKPTTTLMAALLAGAWSDSRAGDREVMESLAGKSYDDITEELTTLAVTLDGPLRKSGDVWKLTSPRDAWLLIAPNLTEALATRFFKNAAQVLGERDPLFALPAEERWAAAIHGIAAKYSAALREGVGEALILLALYGDRSKAIAQPADRVGVLVSNLFEDADAERWWSLRDDFRRLAEAAPDIFLAAVDDAASISPSALTVLFGEDKDAVFGREHLSGLLWALEQLAWTREYFARVAQILAALDGIDPGGRYSNRPGNSLREIFSLWSPQTTLTLAERLKVLDRLRSRQPISAWKLMLRLIPSVYETSTPNARPLWRSVDTDDAEEVTYATIAKGVAELATRLLMDVETSVDRWVEMIRVLPNFPPEIRSTIVQQLKNTVPLMDVTRYEQLRQALRLLINHHQQFPQAEWAMPAAELDWLEGIYAQAEPEDLVARHAWLFSNNPSVPRASKASWEAEQRAVAKLRRDAVAVVLKAKSTSVLFDFAESVEIPGFVGAALVEIKLGAQRVANLLDQSLASPSEKVQNLGRGMLIRGQEVHGRKWIDAVLQRALVASSPCALIVRILRAMPMERATWDQVAALGDDVANEYWRTAPFALVPREAPPSDIEFIVRKLIELERGRQAVFFAGQYLRRGLTSEMLELALRAGARDATPIDAGNEAVMFAHYVGEILDALGTDQAFPAERIAQVEWIYFAVLRNSRRHTSRLHMALANDPAFFVDVLKLVYRATPESGVNEPELPNDERTKALASQAWGLLHDWHRMPGSDDTGTIDAAMLESWVARARTLCAAAGRAEIGDQCIGNVLAAAPVRDGEVWPPVAVREIIESVRSRHVQIGFVAGARKRRGVTTRAMLDGGAQERELASRYRSWAAELQLEWPRTSSTLQEIADSYEAAGQHFDRQAERNEW